MIERNLFTKQKQTHRQRKKKIMVTKGERMGRDKLVVTGTHYYI